MQQVFRKKISLNFPSSNIKPVYTVQNHNINKPNLNNKIYKLKLN